MHPPFQTPIQALKKVFWLLCILLAFQSCSTKYEFATSEVVPAAEGWVKVKTDNNHNYCIKLQLKRLADPKRLTPPKALYIVWMTTAHDGSVNIGQLTTADSFFSSMLESSLNTVTPQKPTGFFITAENENAIRYSGGVVVLKTK